MQRVSIGFLAMFLLASSASAETRIFIIANAPDGYGVDQCLAKGFGCGTLVANAYCQSQDYLRAAGFRRVEPGDVTGAITVADTGSRQEGSAFVAIECTR